MVGKGLSVGPGVMPAEVVVSVGVSAIGWVVAEGVKVETRT